MTIREVGVSELQTAHASSRFVPDRLRREAESMTLMHITLGALSSIFGAHLSWAVTDWIIKRKRDGHRILLPTLLSVAGVILIVVTFGVVVSSAPV
jgi:uncharacterized membrane protein YidH (DUF202 family)